MLEVQVELLHLSSWQLLQRHSCFAEKVAANAVAIENEHAQRFALTLFLCNAIVYELLVPFRIESL